MVTKDAPFRLINNRQVQIPLWAMVTIKWITVADLKKSSDSSMGDGNSNLHITIYYVNYSSDSSMGDGNYGSWKEVLLVRDVQIPLWAMVTHIMANYLLISGQGSDSSMGDGNHCKRG